MENSASVAESDSGQVKQKIPHPDGIDSEKRVYELILDYQREGNPETRQAIVHACSPLDFKILKKLTLRLKRPWSALCNNFISSKL